MKKVLLTVLEPARATLLIAFAIGLGIAVHPVFFLAALLIAIVVLVEAIINASWPTDASASVKPMGTTDWVSQERATTLLGSTCAIVLTTIFLFSLGTASFLYAIHTKSEMAEKNRPAQDGKMGSLARWSAVPGARTKSRSRSTREPRRSALTI